MIEAVILISEPALTKEEFDALLSMVSPEKQERILRYRFFRDAQNSLLGDILARTEICRATGLENQQLVFSVNEFGKPFLTNAPPIHHNISHTEKYIACVVANEPAGIDIERVRPIDLKIAKRFFAPDETAYIMEEPCPRRFFEVWTQKESLIKREGRGLSKPLHSFSVFDPTEAGHYCRVFENDEAICHVCTSDGESPTIRVIGTDMLKHGLLNGRI